MELIREDLPLHYNPLPIALIDTGVGQAVAGHILTHKHEPNGGWHIDVLLETVGVDVENSQDRRAILPHEILGAPVTKYSLTYGANWISPSTPCVRFNYAQKPLR